MLNAYYMKRIYEVVKTRISEREKTTTLNFVYDFATTVTFTSLDLFKLISELM